MTTAEITAALALIRGESDLSAKALLLAGLVSELFRERGFESVVVGGSTIEFYTNGANLPHLPGHAGEGLGAGGVRLRPGAIPE